MIMLWMVLASGTLLPARTDVDRAWSMLTDGAADQKADKRVTAIHALGLLHYRPSQGEIDQAAEHRVSQ